MRAIKFEKRNREGTEKETFSECRRDMMIWEQEGKNERKVGSEKEVLCERRVFWRGGRERGEKIGREISKKIKDYKVH